MIRIDVGYQYSLARANEVVSVCLIIEPGHFGFRECRFDPRVKSAQIVESAVTYDLYLANISHTGNSTISPWVLRWQTQGQFEFSHILPDSCYPEIAFVPHG